MEERHGGEPERITRSPWIMLRDSITETGPSQAHACKASSIPVKRSGTSHTPLPNPNLQAHSETCGDNPRYNPFFRNLSPLPAETLR